MLSGLENMQNLFTEKFISDDRQPVFRFRLARFGVSVGLFAPSFAFWKQVVLASVIQAIFFRLMSVIVYKFIILKRKSLPSYVTASMVVVPACLYFPTAFIALFDIQNMMMRFAAMLLPILCLFRCVEALFNFSLPGSEASLNNYMVYFSALTEVKFHRDTNEPVRPTWESKMSRITTFLISWFMCGIYMSFLAHFEYEPMDTQFDIDRLDHNVIDMLSIQHMLNNLFIGVLIQFLLVVFGTPASLSTMFVADIEVINIMDNPFFGATSPSDFWGRRWNLIIHGSLKRGVFKPARLVCSTNTAVVLTFVASALFHEWIFINIFIRNDDSDGESCHVPHTYGKNLLFFLWNGVLILAEFKLVKEFPRFFKQLKDALPGFVVSMLVVLMALPVGHWFVGEYVKSGYFYHAQNAFPMVKVLD